MATSWEIDHVFVATAVPAVVEAALSDFGMSFTERRVHEGQGTANACARFENAYFELLHANDDAELQAGMVAPLGLHERIHWAETGACPFGVCLRATDAEPDLAHLPFEIWRYRPAYLPAGAGIAIVTPRHHLHEPLVFLSPRDRSSAAKPSHECQRHRGQARTLTGVRIQRPTGAVAVSEGAAWFAEQGVFSFVDGPGYLLELEWDYQSERATRTFPDAAIEVRW